MDDDLEPIISSDSDSDSEIEDDYDDDETANKNVTSSRTKVKKTVKKGLVGTENDEEDAEEDAEEDEEEDEEDAESEDNDSDANDNGSDTDDDEEDADEEDAEGNDENEDNTNKKNQQKKHKKKRVEIKDDNYLEDNYLDDDENVDLDDEEDVDEDDDKYFQKFNENSKKNIIHDFHPELEKHNYEEIETLSHIVRDSQGNIIDPFHKTFPFLTKYEFAKILGNRAMQIDAGAVPFIKLDDDIIDSYVIAFEELKQKKIPFIVKRPFPNAKGCEYWKLKDLEILL